ncbi:MAG: MmgE/PrpD family protein [Nitrospirota bacterium]|nr:MmgE/PrpD family protein [Nitrospirota bacterium]
MIAARLAEYAQSLRYGDLSPAVVHEVKRRVLDSIGCAMSAFHAPPCRIARSLAQSVKVADGATVWGTTHRTLPDLATFANGALVRYLDFNDTYLAKEPAHPSDNIAAVLAVAEARRASGRQVILAIALAYEIQCRLCDAAALRPRGWDHVTYGPFSSALAAAKILNLSAAKSLQAVNVAGVANVALRQTRVGDLSMWKACAFSNAARNGVFAAMLAQQGMTGPSPIFEGEKGFMKLVSGSFDLPAFGGEKEGPQENAKFKILDTYIKHYPVEYHAQTAVEAAVDVRAELLKSEGPQGLADISAVEIGSYDVAIEIIGRDSEKWRPRTRETADHSFPYCVAVALLDGTVTLRSFDEKRMDDPILQALMQKVRVVQLPDFIGRYPGAMPTRLILTTTSGKDYVAQRDYPLGHPRHAMSDREVEEKFSLLTSRQLGPAQTRKIIDVIWDLDRVKDMSVMMPLLKVRRKI